MDSCTICCEKYNKSNNKCITCEHTNCNFKACKETHFLAVCFFIVLPTKVKQKKIDNF